MNPTLQYAFKEVRLVNTRTMVKEPVAAAVHKSNTRRVTIRIDAVTAKRCGFQDGDVLTPFMDLPNKAILLLSGQKPSLASRHLRSKPVGAMLEIEFPRVDDFAEVFPVLPIRAMDLKEAKAGRLVFVVPAQLK